MWLFVGPKFLDGEPWYVFLHISCCILTVFSCRYDPDAFTITVNTYRTYKATLPNEKNASGEAWILWLRHFSLSRVIRDNPSYHYSLNVKPQSVSLYRPTLPCSCGCGCCYCSGWLKLECTQSVLWIIQPNQSFETCCSTPKIVLI